MHLQAAGPWRGCLTRLLVPWQVFLDGMRADNLERQRSLGKAPLGGGGGCCAQPGGPLPAVTGVNGHGHTLPGAPEPEYDQDGEPFQRNSMGARPPRSQEQRLSAICWPRTCFAIDTGLPSTMKAPEQGHTSATGGSHTS